MSYFSFRRRRGKTAPRQPRARLSLEALEDRTLLSNPIVQENALQGTPESQWDVSGSGDPTIQGFATQITYNVGETVSFKVNTPSTHYRLDIYRMGYYNGNGARLITSIDKTLSHAQSQPAGIYDSTTGELDCGNWGVSATWAIPSTAVSGIYFAKVVREDSQDPGGASHIVFVVRNDASHSDILFKTADATWEAYNAYGGQSLYDFDSDSRGHAFAVSYNRPFIDGDAAGASWVFWAEYPMVRFMEANGYDISYFTDADADLRGSEILNHKVFMDTGHDEYWSGPERNSVESARAAGVNLAFFSGNEMFWKTRYAASIDGSNSAERTLVCYKETNYNQPIDPLDTSPTWTWTGTWMDPRFSPPADGGRPQNALTGQLFAVNNSNAGNQPGWSMTVASDFSKLRFWRNTAVATQPAGSVLTLATWDIIGYEWDEDQDNGFRPAGLIDMSSTTLNVGELLLDYGSTYGPGVATHSLTLYRYSSGALVFGAGTVQWSHGLDSNHIVPPAGDAPTDPNVQQATINLFADMHVQPGSLQAGLVPATASTDTTPPTSVITYPTAGSTLLTGNTYTITGTATDAGGGVVAGVEVSVDGGNTWHPASSMSPADTSVTWSFSWTPSTVGSVTIRSRATDDSGNIETPSAGVTVTVRPTDTTPPTISGIAAVLASNQSATISWTTDKPSTSQVIYGTNPQSLNQSASAAALVTAHSVSLSGLSPSTTYYYRVVSADQFGNTATSPATTSPPLAFSLPAFLDTSVADFSAGTQSGTAVTNSAGGEVQIAPSLLTPVLSDDFGGTALSSSWTSHPTGLGTARQTVSGSVLSLWATEVDSAQAYANLPPLEGSVAFGASPYQSFGLATSTAASAGNYWALFGTDGTTNTLFARVNVNGATQDVSVGALPAGFHTYRVQPVTGGFQFLVDGVVKTTLTAPFPANTALKVVMGDSYGTYQPFLVDWVHVGGDSAGTFTSRVFDAGAPVTWASASSHESVPVGTTLALNVRMGNTPTPDSTWTDWVPSQTEDNFVIGGVSRYIQYQAVLNSSNPALTPVLQDVSFFTASSDTVAPTVVGRSPAPAATGVALTSPVAVKFSELMNAATISTSTVHLRVSGQSTDVPATVTYSGSTATLQPTSPLAYNTTYQVIVSGTITDVSGNPIGSNITWPFTTTLYNYFTDTAASGFGAGTQSGTALTGGGVQIAASGTTPVLSDDFGGSSLGSSWTSFPTGYGPARQSEANSVLSLWATEVDSAQAFTNLPPLEGSVAFGASPYQSFGLATSTAAAPGNYWAMFGTIGTTNTLFARVNVNGATQDVNVGALPAGFHTYRVQPVTGGFQFLVDGAVLTTLSAAFPANTPLKVVMGDAYGTYQPFQIDWAHVLSGYPSAASFTSRVFDAGGSVTWASASWDSAVPAGTGLAVSVRMGNTATPDSTWTDWVPLSGSGATIGGVSRYIQYQATLSNSSPTLTPVLQDLTLAYNALPDTVAPTIASRSPASGATGAPLTAPVVVKFSELMNSATISASTVHLRVSGQTTDVPAVVTYSGSTATLQPNAPLAYNTTYQVIVSGSITDASGNPLGSNSTWTFTTTLYSYFTDTTASFGAGTLSNTLVGAGGVQLAPSASILALSDDFGGTALSSSWTSYPSGYGSSPRLTVSNSVLSLWATDVDSVKAFTNLPPLEGSVAFGASPYQPFGLATGLAAYAGNYWALFDTMGTTNTLFARVNVNGATQDVSVGALPAGFHTYRIQPVAGGFQFLVDGTVLTTLSATFPAGTALKVVMADPYGTYQPFQIDWAHVFNGYPASGTYTSRVFDAGGSVTWASASWDSAVPAGTGLAVSVRMGNTATPDSTWTDWVPLASSGATIGGVSRYIQYQAALTGSDPTVTPVLQDITLAYNTLPDTVAPRIVSFAPASGATGVAARAPVVVKFSELMNGATISASTVHLRVSGQTTDVPAVVTYSGSTVTLQPSAPLAGNTTYQVIVSGTITDASGNPIGSNITWSFTTGIGTWQQSTATDFGAGTQSGTQLAAGGGVQLAPSASILALSDDFGGTSLGSSWTSTPTGLGTARQSEANSVLSLWATEVDSAKAFTNLPPLEGSVAFGASPYQSFGLATSLAAVAGNYWALFGTIGTTNTLFARVNVNGATQDVNVGALPAGFHTYRVQPVAGGFQFLVDGVVKATLAAAFPANTPLKVVMGDAYGTYQPFQIDWAHVFNGYPASGTFTSSVFDAGRVATWGSANWTANLPANTTMVVQTRSGNTATPDATWSAWTTVINGGTVASPAARYLQYQIIFTTTDPTATATLSSITFLYT
jgi:hypothetical protein